MARLSTHVLDTARGLPAKGVTIELHRIAGSQRLHVATMITNADGRTDAPMLSGERIETGVYELTFHAGDYLRECGVALKRPSVSGPSCRAIRDRRAGEQLSRTVADLALRLQHVSGILIWNRDDAIPRRSPRSNRTLPSTRDPHRGAGLHYTHLSFRADALRSLRPARLDGAGGYECNGRSRRQYPRIL